MAPSSAHSRVQSRSKAYQGYLDDCDSFYDTLIRLCAGRFGYLRIQRQRTLKYFQSLSDPNESRDEAQDNEETQLLGGEIRGLASRYTLSRENSNFSTGNTSYYSAVQYQPSLDENVAVQPCDTRPPIISDVPELYAPYSITTASHVQDGSAPRSMILIPVARPRPRRLILDIETACAQGAEFDRLQGARTLKDEKTTAITNFKLELAAGQSVGVAIEPSALETYLAQSREAERWDIKAWVRDNIAAEERARIAVPKPLRQCEAYYKMKNFNPFNLHKLDPAEGEQQYKNMAVALAQARRNCRPLEVRRMELARMEEARMAEACLAEEAGMVEARTTEQAHEVNNSHINEESELDGDLQRQGATNRAASLAKSGTISGKPRARKLRSAGLGLVRSNVRKGMRMVAGTDIFKQLPALRKQVQHVSLALTRDRVQIPYD